MGQEQVSVEEGKGPVNLKHSQQSILLSETIHYHSMEFSGAPFVGMMRKQNGGIYFRLG